METQEYEGDEADPQNTQRVRQHGTPLPQHLLGVLSGSIRDGVAGQKGGDFVGAASLVEQLHLRYRASVANALVNGEVRSARLAICGRWVMTTT